MFSDILKGAVGIVASVTGSIIGVSTSVIATTLGFTVEMVEEAIDSGCTTYEEIQKFIEDKY